MGVVVIRGMRSRYWWSEEKGVQTGQSQIPGAGEGGASTMERAHTCGKRPKRHWRLGSDKRSIHLPYTATLRVGARRLGVSSPVVRPAVPGAS